MKNRAWVAVLLLLGFVGMERACSSATAAVASDAWIVVQYRADGSALNCWKVRGTPVIEDERSGGLFWPDQQGHRVHISGWHNRVQVSGERWDEAAKKLGVDAERCKGGAYVPGKNGA